MPYNFVADSYKVIILGTLESA